MTDKERGESFRRKKACRGLLTEQLHYSAPSPSAACAEHRDSIVFAPKLKKLVWTLTPKRRAVLKFPGEMTNIP